MLDKIEIIIVTNGFVITTFQKERSSSEETLVAEDKARLIEILDVQIPDPPS